MKDAIEASIEGARRARAAATTAGAYAMPRRLPNSQHSTPNMALPKSRPPDAPASALPPISHARVCTSERDRSARRASSTLNPMVAVTTRSSAPTLPWASRRRVGARHEHRRDRGGEDGDRGEGSALGREGRGAHAGAASEGRASVLTLARAGPERGEDPGRICGDFEADCARSRRSHGRRARLIQRMARANGLRKTRASSFELRTSEAWIYQGHIRRAHVRLIGAPRVARGEIVHLGSARIFVEEDLRRRIRRASGEGDRYLGPTGAGAAVGLLGAAVVFHADRSAVAVDGAIQAFRL